VNGGFETNTCASTTWCDYGAGYFAEGWYNDYGTIDVQFAYDGQWFAYEGIYTVDISGNAPYEGAIYQYVPTQIGHTYTVSWVQSGNFYCDPAVKVMHVQATGGDSVSYYFDTTGNTAYNMQWQSQSYTFTATSSSTRVEFFSDTPTCGGMVLDAISMVDVTPASVVCADSDPSDWNQYGQAYYCSNNFQGFIQCWGSAPYIQGLYQNCASGTTCRCAVGVECSGPNGNQSPCA